MLNRTRFRLLFLLLLLAAATGMLVISTMRGPDATGSQVAGVARDDPAAPRGSEHGGSRSPGAQAVRGPTGDVRTTRPSAPRRPLRGPADPPSSLPARRSDGPPRRVETAVTLALDWLAGHQDPDGRWDAERFTEHCGEIPCGHPGDATFTPGTSGLALLAFLGCGETHQSGAHKGSVKFGLRYLKDIQDSEGCFGPRTSPRFQYNHACAALAMTEAYGVTGSRLFKDSAQRGVAFTDASRNPYFAWRYGVRDGDNDTSVAGWMAMVVRSAEMAELDVDPSALGWAVAWLDEVTDPATGRAGYRRRGDDVFRFEAMRDRFPADRTEAPTASATFTRILAGHDPRKSEIIQKGAALMARRTPRWDPADGSIDLTYWYFGTLAMFEVGGDSWQRWRDPMLAAILEHQSLEVESHELGSWDALGPWAPQGGRVYSTSLMSLCLRVSQRYGRVISTR